MSEGLRPLVEPSIPEKLSAVLEDCWQLDSKKRPAAEELVQRLRHIVSHANFAQRPIDSTEEQLSTKQREEARKASSAQSGRRREEAHADKELNPHAKFKVPSWIENRASDPVKVRALL